MRFFVKSSKWISSQSIFGQACLRPELILAFDPLSRAGKRKTKLAIWITAEKSLNPIICDKGIIIDVPHQVWTPKYASGYYLFSSVLTIFSRDAPVFAMLGGSRRMGKGTICLCIYTHKKAKTCIYLYTAAQTAQAEQTEKPWYSMYNSIKLCCSNHIYSDPNTMKVEYLLFIPVKICSEEIFTKMKQKIKSTFLGPATPFHRATQYIKSSFHFSGSRLCNGWEDDSFVI